MLSAGNVITTSVINTTTVNTSITIGTQAFALSKQLPTGNYRSAIVSGVPTVLDTAYLETREKGVPVIRTVRKVNAKVTLSINGVSAVRDIGVSFVLSRPIDVPVDNAGLLAAMQLMKAWSAQTTFDGEIYANEI